MKSKQDDDDGISTLEAGWFVLKNSVSLYRIYSQLRKAFPMKNWKTTISSLLGALVIILKLFGVEVPQPVSDGVLAVSLFLVGRFAKDYDQAGV